MKTRQAITPTKPITFGTGPSQKLVKASSQNRNKVISTIARNTTTAAAGML